MVRARCAHVSWNVPPLTADNSRCMRFVPLLLIAVAAGVADAACEGWCNQCAHCGPLSPPPLPSPPLPLPSPLPLSRRLSVLAVDTCVHNAADCDTCATCTSVLEGTFCAAWCNDYTCAHGLCTGCSACDYLKNGGTTRCLGWHRPLVPIVSSVGWGGQLSPRSPAGSELGHGCPFGFRGRACRGPCAAPCAQTLAKRHTHTRKERLVSS